MELCQLSKGKFCSLLRLNLFRNIKKKKITNQKKKKNILEFPPYMYLLAQKKKVNG